MQRDMGHVMGCKVRVFCDCAGLTIECAGEELPGK